MRLPLARIAPWLAFGLIVLAALAGAGTGARYARFPADGEFNIAAWELQHLPNKWLYLTGRFFGGEPPEEVQDERLTRFLSLTARIQASERRLAAGEGDAEAPGEETASLRDEREALENHVEATIEGRLTAVLDDAGLESTPPLAPGARVVFPPVDVEFDRTPRVLAVSPRDEIRLIEQRPLRQEIGAEEAERIEREVEADGRRSALVTRVTGAATYPSIVEPASSYEDLATTVAHEWTHHYLFFRPLGVRYLESVELRTLNETVADIVGRELALALVARYPLPPEAAWPAGRPDPALEAEVARVLRELRLEVEALLDDGKVAEAEALMEQRRRELAARGVTFRRINQAFFAFRGIYATEPGSIDPIGLQLLYLRARSGSLEDFLRSAGGLTGVGDLERLLADGGQGRR